MKKLLYSTVYSVSAILPKLNKLILIAALCFGAALVSCGGDSDEPTPTPDPKPESETTSLMTALWKTTPITTDLTARKAAFANIQTAANGCSNTIFKSYLSATDVVATSLENSYPIIKAYDEAFDRVLDGVKSSTPAKGEVHIWMLYNMGYVVKTSSGTFAVDIFHRRAEELASYLDFYAITHIHTDHKSEPLAQAMGKLGKPVLTNFSIEGILPQYVSTENTDYEIGSFKIHTFITNHNNSSTNVNITVFRVDCGEAGGNCVIMHSGDSNFIAEQYQTVKNDNIDIYIPRYAVNALTENNVIGAVFNPKFVLLSHILELTHADVANSRWTLEMGLERASKINCENTYMPFWGEKIIWKDGKLN